MSFVYGGEWGGFFYHETKRTPRNELMRLNFTRKATENDLNTKLRKRNVIHSLNNIISMFLSIVYQQTIQKLFIVIPTVYDIRE